MALERWAERAPGAASVAWDCCVGHRCGIVRQWDNPESDVRGIAGMLKWPHKNTCREGTGLQVLHGAGGIAMGCGTVCWGVLCCVGYGAVCQWIFERVV